MCLLDFWTRMNELSLFFWAIKVIYFDLTKNNQAALNSEHLANIWNPANVKLQTAVYGLQFPMKNLMLKVLNEARKKPTYQKRLPMSLRLCWISERAFVH